MPFSEAWWFDPGERWRLGGLRFENGRIRVTDAPSRGPSSQNPEGAAPLPRLLLSGDAPLLLPGLIDGHVHFRQPGDADKEGIANGSRAALAGGVTTTLDMPNTRPPTDTAARLAAKRRLFAARAAVNWGLHFSPARTNGETPIPTGIAAAKVFMARSGGCPAVTTVEGLVEVMMRFPRVAIHAEDETHFPPRGPEPRPHGAKRPRAALTAALAKIETARCAIERRRPRGPFPKLIILHLSTAAEIEVVRRWKARGWDVAAETCPHYLFFTENDWREAGPRLQVNPPLRSASDRTALREALADGTIDLIGSDHAPHRPAEKADPATSLSGMPGLERMWPLLLHLVEEGSLSFRRARDVGCRNPAHIYGLAERGDLRDGLRSDLVLVRRSGNPGPRSISSRAGYDPYAGLPLSWEVEAVWVNGAPAFTRGRFPSHSSAMEVYRHENP